MQGRPSGIAWVLDEIAQRHHGVFRRDGTGCRVEWVLPIEDDAVAAPNGLSP